MQDPIFEESNSLRNKYQIDKLNNDGRLVYHYTSLQGLRGILTSKVFFATEGKFLNDSSEIKYIKRIINVACDMVEGDLDPELIKNIRWYNKDVEWLDVNKVFVLSLSERSDSLILWSSYSKHDGYNIGINPYELEMEFFCDTKKFFEINLNNKSNYIYLEHGRVIYDYNKQISIISDELHNLNNLYDKADCPLKRIPELCNSFFNRMLFYSAFFKDAGFCDECEYRIAVTSNKYHANSEDGRGGLREAHGCLLHYHKIPVQSEINVDKYDSPIKEITIGPINNLEFTEKDLELFKNECGFNKVTINKSAIPLRY